MILKSQLKEWHVSVACDADYEKKFPYISVIGFRDKENLKPHLVRAVPLVID